MGAPILDEIDLYGGGSNPIFPNADLPKTRDYNWQNRHQYEKFNMSLQSNLDVCQYIICIVWFV